ncbi:ABC transporter permease [Bifidobacterium mellis]|uniref:ABC transporter, permease protein, putative Daunorubicin, doxorubicin (Drug resistance) exporter n=1 Tax=Bifidobacterium mellis TaxID=1293823 RepID=A0A0F4KUV5_9BIFI|nr:ABC transporter permease [Bifidobacterium mellis]KJY50195.1 ABC transporter, permease protein, putative Daunorubicin, doxorubicin (Drug resistance) exporter [Bifidobacterium mellis]
MNTCKTALRIIWAHKFYLLLYLVGMSLIMIVIGSTNVQAAVRANASSSIGRFEPARAKVVVINRDSGNQAGCELGQGLKKYLGKSAQLVTVEDKPQALQDANVSGKSDLTVIIPKGYGQRFLETLEDTAAQARSGGKTTDFPKVETAASYNSSRGSLAQLQVDSYFDAIRTALLSGLGQNGSTDLHSPAAVKDAAAYAVAYYAGNQPHVGIHASPKNDDGALLKGFATTVGLAAFPLMTALTVCVATLFGAFSSPDRHRRLLASPIRSSSLNGQELTAALIVAGVSWAYYVALVAFSMAASGVSLASFGWGRVLLSFFVMLIFAVSAASFGFMLSQFNPSSSLINSVGVTFGLVVMFTSGSSSGGSLPPVMQTIGKLTPGWWYNTAVQSIMDSSTTGLASWGLPLTVVALFALAYACVGLMVSRLTRTRATLVAPVSSDPSMIG